jgi:thiol-disulfide isomerase/thioredoxin
MMHTAKKHPARNIILGIVVVVVVAMLYLLLQPKQASTPNDSTKDSQQQSESTDVTMAPGSYIDYNEETFSQTEGKRILFFYAPWCPQCRALEASIKENTLPAGVTIFKVDYDSNQELRAKYGVTIQTSLVEVDGSGNLVEKFIAYDEPSYGAVKVAFDL